jgi:hypothetical protein
LQRLFRGALYKKCVKCAVPFSRNFLSGTKSQAYLRRAAMQKKNVLYHCRQGYFICLVELLRQHASISDEASIEKVLETISKVLHIKGSKSVSRVHLFLLV